MCSARAGYLSSMPDNAADIPLLAVSYDITYTVSWSTIKKHRKTFKKYGKTIDKP